MFIAVVLAAISATIIFQKENKAVRQEMSGVAADRAGLVRENTALAKALVLSLRNNMETNIKLSEMGALSHPAVKDVTDFPALNIYGLEALPGGGVGHLVGNLSGIGRVAALDEAHWQEIAAALALTPNFTSAITALPDLKWVYYLSARGFVYLAPDNSIVDVHVNDSI